MQKKMKRPPQNFYLPIVYVFVSQIWDPEFQIWEPASPFSIIFSKQIFVNTFCAKNILYRTFSLIFRPELEGDINPWKRSVTSESNNCKIYDFGTSVIFFISAWWNLSPLIWSDLRKTARLKRALNSCSYHWRVQFIISGMTQHLLFKTNKTRYMISELV